ncbi:MAG: class I SAM-dependent methyltransferase [Candidatus Obscuribacterales bacterium]|nr:class I SAM-dependent methyltransferase [Candidatus Obscuribacterales bacterium]
MATTKDDVKRQFGRNASNYATSAGHAHGFDLEIVFDLLGANRRFNVLDIATGAGHTAARIAPHVAQVTAIDLAAEMITESEKLFKSRGITNATARVMDVEALEFDDASFDAVTCRIAPHHFLDIKKSISEIARVLSPRGVFILEDSCSPQDERLDQFINYVETLRDPTHVRSYSELEWRQMLSDNGFKIKKTRHYKKTHEIVDWMDKAGLAKSKRPLVLATFRQASQAAIEEFEIEFDGETPVSYTDDKVILRAVKSA